ncbi:MAG: DEAD/DEAH box helicase family protein, partial [Blautia sp.]|nr:DEAD/DEAH box helicase family protein [Blautia sp.]
MGCGKTLVSIAVAGALYQADKIQRVLVVAPLSLLGNWEDEFTRFSDFPVAATVLKGTMEKKRETLKKAGAESGEDKPLAVAIVNYESAWRMEKNLMAYAPDLIIVDEGHKIKEGRTSQSKCLHHLGDRAMFRLLLTGTVITNKEIDVWSQYRFVDPRIFGKS